MIHANYKKQETVNRLKKVYSTLSQTTNRAIADNGPIDTWEIEADNPSAPAIFAEKYLVPYLNIMRNCKTNTNDKCTAVLKYLNGTIWNPNSNAYRFILSDGTTVIVNNAIVETEQGYSKIYVDINGMSKPNVFGKDIFIFEYYIRHKISKIVGKLRPSLEIQTREGLLHNTSWGCNKNASGFACGALIMRDNWQIKEDYPW